MLQWIGAQPALWLVHDVIGTFVYEAVLDKENKSEFHKLDKVLLELVNNNKET